MHNYIVLYFFLQIYEKTLQKMEELAPLLSDSFDFDANASSIHLAENADVSEMELALPVTSTS